MIVFVKREMNANESSTLPPQSSHSSVIGETGDNEDDTHSPLLEKMKDAITKQPESTSPVVVSSSDSENKKRCCCCARRKCPTCEGGCAPDLICETMCMCCECVLKILLCVFLL